MSDNPEEFATDDFELDLGSVKPTTEDDIEIDLNFGDFADGNEIDRELDVNLDLGQFGQDAEAEVSEAEKAEEAEADAEVDKALEAMRTELRSKIGDWYVVHTYSGMENRVKQNIDSRVKTLNMEEYIFESVVPTEDAIEVRNGTRKTVTRSVLPGYVLVRMDLTDDSWATVRHTPSVTGFVGHATQPVPLSLDEVERMLTPSVLAKAAAAGNQTSRTRKKVEVVDFQIGDSVMVVDGPFTGVHATITEINLHNQRLKANVEILGRETPVDLTFPQIQKV